VIAAGGEGVEALDVDGVGHPRLAGDQDARHASLPPR
jgi:hypothetical protein